MEGGGIAPNFTKVIGDTYMVFFVGVFAGSVVAATITYFVNKSFRAKVQTDLAVLSDELASLKTKAVSGTAIVEADFTTALAAAKSLFSKL